MFKDRIKWMEVKYVLRTFWLEKEGEQTKKRLSKIKKMQELN
jgi:uncharacterized protein YdaU (DUF1376 family)